MPCALCVRPAEIPHLPLDDSGPGRPLLPPERAGVTSLVRLFASQPSYRRFLHLFHSRALDLDALTACWARLCLRLLSPSPWRAAGLPGRWHQGPERRPQDAAVKLLHQQSASNSKPEYIMGHSFQAVSLLVQGRGNVAAVPLVSRIHEGLIWSTATCAPCSISGLAAVFSGWHRRSQVAAGRRCLLRVGKMITTLLGQGHQLVTRAKSNAVAYWPVQVPRAVARTPRPTAKKVKLKDLARDESQFISAPSPVYGEQNVTLRYRAIDLLWRPADDWCASSLFDIRCAHDLPAGHRSDFEPLEIVLLYGYRFKIELGFPASRACRRKLRIPLLDGDMKPRRRDRATNICHRESQTYRDAVRRKINAFHLHVQLAASRRDCCSIWP